MKKIISVFLPEKISNVYKWNKIPLYVFYLITAVTLWRSFHHILSADGGAQSIANIPLDSYSEAAAATVITMFALWGLSQLLIGIIMLVASIKYKSIIPSLYLLLLIEYCFRIIIGQLKPIITTASAPGAIANLPVIIIAVLMLIILLKK